jgi:hypothetical protein
MHHPQDSNNPFGHKPPAGQLTNLGCLKKNENKPPRGVFEGAPLHTLSSPNGTRDCHRRLLNLIEGTRCPIKAKLRYLHHRGLNHFTPKEFVRVPEESEDV